MSRQNWHFRKKIRQVVQKYNFNQLLSNAFCPILIINQKILGAMVINMDLESTIVEIICQHIMKTNGYGELLTAYNNNAPRADVLRRYQTFINNYFSEDSLKELQEIR